MAETGVLQRAIKRRQWETAALCLLVAVAETANRLPPAAIEEMLELLTTEEVTHSRPRRRLSRKRR